MPLLPGDSLLFAAGALAAATGALEIWIIIPLLILAALLGDNVNYFVGKFFGKEIKKRERILFFKREYIEETEKYYAKYGGKTVIIARYIPIVRTIAPFVAGAGMVMLVVILQSVGLKAEGLAMILAVDRILDMCRTVVNVTSDATVALIIDSKNK